MEMFISAAKSRTVSGSRVTPRVNRINLLARAERTSSLPHQPRPTIAALSIVQCATLAGAPGCFHGCAFANGASSMQLVAMRITVG